ncbi:hypothetical protein SEVIR_4G018900v4 [Setaria viridis]|uniref:Uncharacterized protein n=2 Tax=Setaria TaxID=4554 RepID=A0A368QPS6_SETIT|nr:hypothetical protein SETIT_4G019000v2 [Setaria italica]TKW19421.1 hypothetical protein SEVIR_4G018900v2 [Setaria viridis]
MSLPWQVVLASYADEVTTCPSGEEIVMLQSIAFRKMQTDYADSTSAVVRQAHYHSCRVAEKSLSDFDSLLHKGMVVKKRIISHTIQRDTFCTAAGSTESLVFG